MNCFLANCLILSAGDIEYPCSEADSDECYECDPEVQRICDDLNRECDEWYEEGDTGSGGFCNVCNTWFPEATELFKPFVADPRQLNYSVGWRFDDQVLHKDIIDVSFGDSWTVYEWCNLIDRWPWNGRLQFEVVGGVWAVFSPRQESAPLINADYMGGAQFTYAIKNWAFRLRGFHISSHIGDEFLIMHPRFCRLNPSAEFLDIFVSHQLSKDIRIYGGIGWIVHQDTSFQTGRIYGECGMEIRLLSAAGVDWKNQLYGTPFYGMHFRFNSDYKKHVDSTYVLGYEWGKTCGLYRKVRVYIEYHDGYSLEGQFAKCPTNYFSIRASYGF